MNIRRIVRLDERFSVLNKHLYGLAASNIGFITTDNEYFGGYAVKCSHNCFQNASGAVDPRHK